MKRKITLKIEYKHEDKCNWFNTHDDYDCDCGAWNKKDEEIVLDSQTKQDEGGEE